MNWPAVAVVLQGALANYWLSTDLLRHHPAGVDEDRFIASLVTLTFGLLTSTLNAERAPSKAAETADNRTQPSKERR